MKSKRRTLFIALTVLALAAVAACMMVIGRGHEIYLDNKTLQVLHEWRNEQRIILLQHGFNSSSSKQLVFSNYKTNSFLNGTMPNFWAKRVQKKAGLDRIAVHGLRHTYATLAIQAGMNPKELQIQLGHKDIQVTLGIYTSLTQQQQVETPDKFTAFVNF